MRRSSRKSHCKEAMQSFRQSTSDDINKEDARGDDIDFCISSVKEEGNVVEVPSTSTVLACRRTSTRNLPGKRTAVQNVEKVSKPKVHRRSARNISQKSTSKSQVPRRKTRRVAEPKGMSSSVII